MSILSMTAVELAAAIKKREVTVKEAVEAVLDNIEKNHRPGDCRCDHPRG